MLFFFHHPATTEIYTLSLHDALPISLQFMCQGGIANDSIVTFVDPDSNGNYVKQCRTLDALRSEEHTSELQSQFHLVCRLLLEKKKKKDIMSRVTLILMSLRATSVFG